MLDNTMATNTTTLPMEILADAKILKNKHFSQQNSEDLQQNSTLTKTNKTKTILNWLKQTTNNTKTNCNNNNLVKDNTDINSCHQNRFDKVTRQTGNQKQEEEKQQQQQKLARNECTCPTVKQQNSTRSNKSSTAASLVINNNNNSIGNNIRDDDLLREFRGVQTLKHLWNKRITANKESALRAKDCKHHPNKQFTKSVSCLLNTINNSGGEPPPLSPAERLKVRKLRALSLHDCSLISERDSLTFDDLKLTDIEIQKHLEKDNFYKYKTAEQASKLRELSEHSTARRLSNGIVVPKTEYLNWFKRHEKINKKKSIDDTKTPAHSSLNVMRSDVVNVDNLQDFDNVSDCYTSATIYDDIIINERIITMHSTRNSLTLPTAIGQNNNNEVGQTTAAAAASTNNGSESSTPTLTATNSPLHVISRRSATTRKDSSKSLASAASISRDSSANSLTLSSSGPKSHVKRNSSTRKYSFKTHSRSYHAPRKMHTNKENVLATSTAGTGQSSSNPANSLVAKLTQQFNEIIQKDKSVLEEIKRKNGVIMTHKGHVYKVVGTGSLSRNQTPSLSRSSSKSQDINGAEKLPRSSVSTVQQNIQKFERESRGLKPKVPLKSKHVLKKSEVIKNLAAENRGNLNKSKQIQKENETKLEAKPNSLNIPASALEMVQEEAKTPVDSKDFDKKLKEKMSHINPDTEEIGKSRKENTKLTETSSDFQKANETRIEELRILENSNKKSPAKSLREKETDLENPNFKDSPTKPLTDLSNNNSTSTCVIKQSTIEIKPTDKEGVPLEIGNPHVSLDKENKENKINVEANNQKSQLYSKTKNKQQESLHTENFDKVAKDTKVLDTSTEETLLKDFEKVSNIIAPRKNSSLPASTEETLAKDFENVSNEISPRKDSLLNKESSLQSPDSPEHSEDDDKRKRKHKYAQIYEKLRLVNIFSHSNKKQKLTSATSPNMVPTETNKSKESTQEKPTLDNLISITNHQYTPMNSPEFKLRRNLQEDYSPMFNPEAKLLDALEKVDQKLQNLSERKDSLLNLETDEYGVSLKPNTSFLHQSQAKDVIPKPAQLIQAVNVTLVNAIEGEQMIMEQKEIQEEKLTYQNETETKQQLQTEEPIYEPICTINELTTEISQTPTGIQYKTCEYTSQKIEWCGTEAHVLEESIYQTVDEVKLMEDSTSKMPDVKINSKPELDGYEPIENCVDSPFPPLKCNISNSPKIIHFDGYEECSPPVDITPITPPTLGVRKVTDQLPEIPEPKRILQKSPILPCRTAPKPPILNLKQQHHHVEEEKDEESLIAPLRDSNYDFDDQENIYDTIKGIHCYESLQSYNNKLQNCPASSIVAECISLTSNCYESIPHYKRSNTTIGHHHHHSGGSSNGSTITISSDQKTNSLYDGSLTLLQYSSKRIYRSNTIDTHKGLNKSIDADSVNGGYAGSVGRASDTSDEWTDVTDNENGDEDNGKPQFIIVRERSKVHKSPDWSRRVRDKRQRKSKSCIEDDDPDHYYEQLSPQALSKRHPSLEQTHTQSLQRNQDMVRISKRNKQIFASAHALGQQISDDSFDSDTDYYESEHIKNSHNDSGVDVGNRCILPEPPASSNQKYSIVKMFKNFIVNKKSPNSSKHGGSQQKIYENPSQFYVSGQYEGKQSSLQVPVTKELSTSEKNLIMAQSAVSKPEPVTNSTTLRKPKSGKSFRSRLRKSLVGFDNKQLSVLTPTRSTFYIEDPGHDDSNGQLDSGFSEKALSGDLPTTPTTLPHMPESPKFSTLAARKSKKDIKSSNTQRRRTIVGIRPNDPPPPPPPTENGNQTKRLSNTSWYAECGVFKNGTTNLVHDDSQILNSRTAGSGSSFAAGSTWYEEAGLYQTSGVSVASSSGSSGVSTSNEAGTSDEISHSMFSNEPLYQIYSAAKLEAISRDMQDESSTDGYEEIGDRNKNGTAADAKRKSSRPSALQLVEPKSGPERTLWCQIPEVINSYIIPTMTQRERALMEAKFEIITSEASYLKSLNLLRTHYMNHPIFRDQNIVSSRDRKFLFAHIVPVHECSEKLLTELESCWQDNIMLVGLSKRIYAIAEKHFHVYIGFCEHQGRMDRTLKVLREGKGLFSQNLELLESSATCCGLNLHSFLMLPMQRITRLPLLIDAVFSKCHPNDDEYENWKMCLAIMNKIVTHCNEAANKSEQAFEIERISRQLEFNASSIRPLAIAPAGVLAPGTKPRFLVKKGELTHLIWRGDEAKLTFGKKFSKITIFAFLFSDLLVLTKRKADEHFSVFDYCPRNMLTITSGDTLPQLPTKDFNSQTSKNLILMTLLENHERKTVELLFSCPSVSEQERWLQAMRPPESETPGEKLYEQWDCPQVMAKHLYENNEPDVLNLEVGDVVNVTRKLPDGWYKGERIRDGAVGWFPGSFTEEVNSVHVRARNLKQRHRLLTFTATYLESQKRNK